MAFIRRFFTHLDDFRRGDRRSHYLLDVENHCCLTAEAMREAQWERLRQILRVAYESVPFYTERFKAAGVDIEAVRKPSDLLRIPMLTREDIREHQDVLINPNIPSHERFQTATGGTTDSPISLFLDKDCLHQRRAATLYFNRWFGYEVGDSIAYLWGAQQDFPPRQGFKSRIRTYLTGPTLWLPSSYLSDNVLWNYYAQLKAFRPKVLQAYPTPLFIFASFLAKNGLELPIKRINVVAESLYDFQREKIESVFSTKIYNWYGARELGHIATECHLHQGLHINTSSLYVEVVRDGAHIYDQPGQLVMTDLLNRAMPLIRYNICDIGSLYSRPCPCGSSLPLMGQLEGRYVDTFKKRDGSCIPGVSLTNRILKDHLAISGLQIIQKEFDRFQLSIVKGSAYQSRDLDSLKEQLCQFMHDPLSFDVD